MFSQIMVPLDGSKLSERALPHAFHMADVFQSNLILLQVLESGHAEEKGLIDPLAWQIKKTETELYLQTLENKVKERHPRIEHQILEGKTSEAILQFAQNRDVDLLVMSSHGRGGLSRWNISSVIQKVISKAYLPMLIVRAYQPGVGSEEPLRYKKIMLPTDCSKRAECSLPSAIAIAEANEAQILLVNVLRKPEIPFSTKDNSELHRRADDFMTLSRKAVEEYMEELSSRISVKNEIRIIESNSVSLGLHDLADQEDVDLLVFCAHGHTGHVNWPYGSITYNYIENGSRSVLVVQDIPHSIVHLTQAEIAAAGSGIRG